MPPAPDQPETSSTEERLVELLAEGQKSNSSVMKILIIGICALAAALIIVVAAVVGADLHISFLGIDAGGGSAEVHDDHPVAASAAPAQPLGPMPEPEDVPEPTLEPLFPGPRYKDTGSGGLVPDQGAAAPAPSPWGPTEGDTGTP